jgi:hypothetical protein
MLKSFICHLNGENAVKRTYILLLSGLNLLLVASILITFDKSLLVYAQKLDTNNTDILITVPTKANVTEGAATTKANVTEGAATKASYLKTNDKKNVKFCYNSQFGSLGTGDGQFNRPHDIVFDSKGFLYINDRELNNFQKFSPNGKFISKFGEEGEELGQFKSHYSMAIDHNDNIYI